MTGPVLASPSAPPDCTLYISGSRYADGSPGWDTDPVAMSGLQVQWGRQTVLDQPAPATATFAVLDLPGGPAFRDRLAVGVLVEVHAAAILYPDPTVSVADDPGFEGATFGGRVTGATAAQTGSGRPAGAPGLKTLRVDPLPGVRAVTVTIPPRAFTTNPVGWDTVPKTQGGQTWHVGLTVNAADPLGAGAASLTLHAVTFDHPNAAGKVIGSVTKPAPASGWVDLDLDVTPPAGQWLGVQLVVTNLSPPWSKVPPAVTWSSLGATPTWADVGRVWVDTLEVLAPAEGALREGCVFAGRVTDLRARYAEDAGGTWIDVAAQDVTGELGNRRLGVTAWPAESASARVARIITGAGQPRTSAVVDASIAGKVMSAHTAGDVTDATAHLQAVAQSAGGVLWCVTSIAGDTFLRIEDLGNRPALSKLVEDQGDGIVRIKLALDAGTGVDMDACWPLLEPIAWRQDTTDAATSVEVTWLEQTAPDPTGQTVTSTDAGGVRDLGAATVALSTLLTTELAAVALADMWLGRLSVRGWRVEGLTLQMSPHEPLDADALDMVMRILDATTRVGLPIMLRNLPGWASLGDPSGRLALYLDGGEFTFEDGQWRLDLATIAATAVGKAAVTWNSLPTVTPAPNTGAWTWNEFDPAIDWDDLAGVSV